MSKLHFLLDMDGVLCDFFTAAVDLLNKHTGNDIKHSELLGSTDLERAFGINTNRFWEIIGSDADFWLKLRPFPWAGELYGFLMERGEVTISSSPSNDPRCHAQKIEWLRTYLGLRSCDVMLGGRKHLMARANHVLIDDFSKNVDKFRAYGGKAILVPSNWNAVVPDGADVFRAISEGLEEYNHGKRKH